jgi:hypothetical protein
MWSGSFATRANTGDPQREQKHRRAPGEDSYSDIKSSPALHGIVQGEFAHWRKTLSRWLVGRGRSDKAEPPRSVQ